MRKLETAITKWNPEHILSDHFDFSSIGLASMQSGIVCYNNIQYANASLSLLPPLQVLGC